MHDSPRGRLTIFLGFAAGVGKTFQMLTEGQELKRRGIDVVVAYFEPHGRAETIALTEGLEIVPRRAVDYKGRAFDEMDTDAVLARQPAVALVDEFPHTNVPGSTRAKRWEDVSVLLDAGIDVMTTMNVQHVESLNDEIWQSTGVRVRETIPDWLLQLADSVVLVDLTPAALMNRLERGVVYPPERAQKALQNFFKEPTLAALRELAMRQTAQVIDAKRHAASSGATSRVAGGDTAAVTSAAPPTSRERLVLVLTPDASSAALIRRGRRVADYLQAECTAVYVARRPDLSDLPLQARHTLERQLTFARRLRIEARVLVGHDVALTLVSFARLNQATQIFIARSRSATWRSLLGRDPVQRIVSLAPDLQVTITADRGVRHRNRFN